MVGGGFGGFGSSVSAGGGLAGDSFCIGGGSADVLSMLVLTGEEAECFRVLSEEGVLRNV